MLLPPTHTERPQKQLGAKINTAPSDSALKRLFSPNDSQGDGDPADNTDSRSDFQDSTAFKGTLLAGFLLLGVIGGYGPAGYALFVAVYAGLEILAIPAIPLTMSAGLLFGSLVGTIIVSISGTVAASVAFLIARYFARERIVKLVEGNKKFLAIDKAIGENGFRVVTLLRLSPLLPFSLGNYLYGLTSVKFIPYVLGSWLGMLPGTWAYVSAGAFGRALIFSIGNFIKTLCKAGFGYHWQKQWKTEKQDESELSNIFGGNSQLLTLGLGLLATALAATYVTRLAKDAIKDIE
ncbi:hypothetical protein ACSQ67_021884 [Phaseolus vulgaris]